ASPEVAADSYTTPWDVSVILDGLVKAGISVDGKDPGMKGVTRYGRLPVGTNTKAKYAGGFAHELVEVNEMARVTPEQVAAAYGIDILEEALLAHRAGARSHEPGDGGVTPGDGQDVFLDALADLGMVKGRASGAGWWDITCPWVNEHTGGVDDGAAYIAGRGAMECHHGHCQDKRAPDFHRRLDELLKEAPGGLVGLGARRARAAFSDPVDPDEVARIAEWFALRDAVFGDDNKVVAVCEPPQSSPIATEEEIDEDLNAAFAAALAWSAAA
ncbi:MAG: hypothetical protein WCJ64_24830, partial [Rhodospirillaceae bacterium]